jgi:hypothetical protein
VVEEHPKVADVNLEVSRCPSDRDGFRIAVVRLDAADRGRVHAHGSGELALRDTTRFAELFQRLPSNITGAVSRA